MYDVGKARDCLRGASPKRTSKRLLVWEWIHSDNGVPVVVSGWESHLQGEGEQVIRHLKEGGTRDA